MICPLTGSSPNLERAHGMIFGELLLYAKLVRSLKTASSMRCPLSTEPFQVFGEALRRINAEGCSTLTHPSDMVGLSH